MQGLVSKEAWGWVLSHVLWENHESEGKNALEHCHDGAAIFFPATNQAFSPHCLSQRFRHLQIISLVHRLATRQKFVMNYALTIKKHSKHHFHIGLNLPCFFGSGWCFWDPMWRLGFCFDIKAVNPSFITCDDVLKSFNQHSHGWQALNLHQHVLFLIFIWQVWHKFGCNMMHAQIFSENLITHGFWNSNYLCYFMKSQTTIGMNHIPNFLDVFFIFWCWSLSWRFTVCNWSSALFKTFVPLMGLCYIHDFVPKC